MPCGSTEPTTWRMMPPLPAVSMACSTSRTCGCRRGGCWRRASPAGRRAPRRRRRGARPRFSCRRNSPASSWCRRRPAGSQGARAGSRSDRHPRCPVLHVPRWLPSKRCSPILPCRAGPRTLELRMPRRRPSPARFARPVFRAPRRRFGSAIRRVDRNSGRRARRELPSAQRGSGTSMIDGPARAPSAPRSAHRGCSPACAASRRRRRAPRNRRSAG